MELGHKWDPSRQCLRFYTIFNIYINDLIKCCIAHSEVYLFADDAKSFKHILSESDEQQLQEGISELHVWTKNWLLNLNILKCNVISFGRTVDKSHTYNITDSDVIPIDRVNIIIDLGILIDEKLTFRHHIHDKINKAYMMLGLIKRNFKYLTFVLLYKNMLRSHLDYCSSVWSPYRKGDIEALEKVQKKATKLLPQLKHKNYTERLIACKLSTLHFRRIRGDMIETYNILSGKYDRSASRCIQLWADAY